MRRGPSGLYRAETWQLGCWLIKVLPARVSEWLARALGELYWFLNRQRRQTVENNLAPIFAEDPRHATAAASRELFRNFGRKLVDLWRYESGSAIDHLFWKWDGWEHFENAQRSGRGILLITPHLGNWELGAPLLAQRGIKLLVITLEEPRASLTRMRQASRLHWGIETVVIGHDPFAFVEVIRRLEDGATVAILVDRPTHSSGVEVSLFGRPFLASLAAAELARATGCVLLPVGLPLTRQGYRAEVLPEIPYKRTELASRPAREKLTQEIMRAFEPMIKQYASQWYHFVPIWPKR